MQSEPTEDIGLKVPSGWKQKLMQVAAQQGVTFSQLVRDAIEQTYKTYLVDKE